MLGELIRVLERAGSSLPGHVQRIDAEAERLLQGTGWLPEGLRTSRLDAPALLEEANASEGDASIAQDEELPAFLGETGSDYPVAAE